MAESDTTEVANLIEDNVPEEMVAKSRVNEIVKREKAAAADRVRREMETLHAQELEQARANSSGSMGGNPQETEAQLEEKIFNRILQKAKEAEEAEHQRRHQAELAERQAGLEKSANQFLMKMAKGKDEFADFDEVMNDFEYTAFPEIALLAGQLDNTPAIMYELSKNPEKIARLDNLASKSPKMALRELEKLSQSIIQNQQAKDNHIPTTPPLSRLKPTQSTAGADSGKMSLNDYKNADWLKA